MYFHGDIPRLSLTPHHCSAACWLLVSTADIRLPGEIKRGRRRAVWALGIILPPLSVCIICGAHANWHRKLLAKSLDIHPFDIYREISFLLNHGSKNGFRITGCLIAQNVVNGDSDLMFYVYA